MAKKTKRHKRRKSGLGAVLNPKSPIIKLAAIAGGYFLGDTINTFLDTLIPDSLTVATPATATAAAKPATLSADSADKILMAGELGLGALLLLKGKMTVVKTVAGGVLAGAGLQRALVSFNIIAPTPSTGVHGYQRVPVIGGYQRVPVIGGVPAQLQGTVSKTPSQLQGYRVNGPGGYVPNGSLGVMGSLYTTADNASGSGITN
jgi:hypothetical protein